MKKTDARIINSKKYLKEALLSLLYEMRISEIKVVSLCQRAEINRATFYSHYNNVYELFNETINEFMNDICKFVSKLNENISKEEKRTIFINLIKYIDKNSELFILYFENSKNIELSGVQSESLQLKIRQKIKSNKGIEDIKMDKLPVNKGYYLNDIEIEKVNTINEKGLIINFSVIVEFKAGYTSDLARTYQLKVIDCDYIIQDSLSVYPCFVNSGTYSFTFYIENEMGYIEASYLNN